MKTTLILPIPEGTTPLVAVHDIVHEKEPIFKRHSKTVERTIHLARILKVPPAEITKYLKKQIGDSIQEGDIIAAKKSMFGKTTIKSPEKGIFKSFDAGAGTLTIECHLGESAGEDHILSHVAGKVVRISDGEIEIETEGHMVGGKKGEGAEASGVLVVSQFPRLSLYDVVDNADGSILLVNEIEDDVMIKLDVVGVKGLIVTREIKETMLPWVLIDEAAFEKLKKHHDKKVMIKPSQGTVILI